jgi:hypothetical protein
MSTASSIQLNSLPCPPDVIEDADVPVLMPCMSQRLGMKLLALLAKQLMDAAAAPRSVLCWP